MPTADRNGLREALTSLLMAYDIHGSRGQAEQAAGAFISGFLSETLAQAETAAQAVAERDEARANYERSLIRCNDLMDRVVRLNAEAAEAEDRIARLSAEVEALRAELSDLRTIPVVAEDLGVWTTKVGGRVLYRGYNEGRARAHAAEADALRTAIAAGQDKTGGGKPTDATSQKDRTDG